MKKIIILLFAAFLTSCASSDGNYLPRWLGYKKMFLYGVPKGDDSFSKGWRDGCDTSLATAGTGALRLIKDKVNAQNSYRMARDHLYDKGFTIGSGYCANFLDYNSG